MSRGPICSVAETPEQARGELAVLLRARPGIEEALGCQEGCADRQLIESLLKHDSPFALLRSLGFDSDTASVAACLLKEARLTPRVRDLARSIEAKLSVAPRPPPSRALGRRKSDMADVQDLAYDWRAVAPHGGVAPPAERAASRAAPRACGFHLGQAVRVAFAEGGLWISGVVTCVEPLEVQPSGASESFEFACVEAMWVDGDAVAQPDADEGAGRCACGAASMDIDLMALDAAKLCLQQGMPQMAKMFIDMVSVASAKAGPETAEECLLKRSCADENAKMLDLPKLSVVPMSIQGMASIVDEEATAEKEAGTTPLLAHKPAELDSRQPKFAPPSKDGAAGTVGDEGALRADLPKGCMDSFDALWFSGACGAMLPSPKDEHRLARPGWLSCCCAR